MNSVFLVAATPPEICPWCSQQQLILTGSVTKQAAYRCPHTGVWLHVKRGYKRGFEPVVQWSIKPSELAAMDALSGQNTTCQHCHVDGAIEYLKKRACTHKDIEVARLLGWTIANSTKGTDEMSYVARACANAHTLTDEGHIDRDDLTDISVRTNTQAQSTVLTGIRSDRQCRISLNQLTALRLIPECRLLSTRIAENWQERH